MKKRAKIVLLVCLALASLLLAGCRAAEPGEAVTATLTQEVAAAASASPESPAAVSATPAAPELPSATPAPAFSPTPTATPTAPARPVGGVELHSLTEGGGLGLLRDTQTHWLRYNALRWDLIEPGPGQRDWSQVAALEQGLQNVATEGYQLILVVHRSPEWALATPGLPCGPLQPEHLQSFADFMFAAVQRYSAPPYNVRYWELGNEPDVPYQLGNPQMPFGCWGDLEDEYFGGGLYAEMLKQVYPRIKAADPQAQVLVGGLLLDCNPLNPPETQPGSGEYKSCASARYLEGILLNGGGDYFDGVSFHAYDYYNKSLGYYSNLNWHSRWNTTGPSLIAKADYLRRLLSAYGYPEKYLINTEVALLCGLGTEPICQTDEFLQTKAAFAAQAYAAAQALGLRGNLWYSITGWRASGLASQAMQPNLAFEAYRFSLEQLQGAAPWGELSGYPGVMGYRFQRASSELWVLWALSDSPQTVVLPARPTAIHDLTGQPLEPVLELQVSTSPVYVEWVEE